MSSSSLRPNNFDLLRLLAAAQVVFVHAVGHTALLESASPTLRLVLDIVAAFPGVAVFFVISGFLVARSCERMRSALPRYFWHRALRIYPALIICLAVTLLVLAGFGFLSSEVLSSGGFWAWLLGQLTCGQFYNPSFFRDFGVGVVNGALWTISVELQFYAVLPLVLLLVQRTRFGDLLLVSSALASFCVFCLVDSSTNRIGGFSAAPLAAKLAFVSILPHWWMFVLGILAHRHWHRASRWLIGRFPLHFAAYCTVATWRHMAVGRDSEWFHIYYLGYLPERILLATMTLSAAFSARHMAARLLRGIDVSYGIYIYHFLIINVMVQLGLMNSLPMAGLVFLLSIAAGAISWFAIEKNALALKSATPAGLARALRLRPQSPTTSPSPWEPPAA